MTKIKEKGKLIWETFKGRILVHCAVGTAADAAVCNELY